MKNPNPLGMKRHALGDLDDGIFVLPAQLATGRRREYFERGQRILAAYMTVATHSGKGQKTFQFEVQNQGLSPTTPIRVEINGTTFETTVRRLEMEFARAGGELTRQFFVAFYGNFEAFLSDHVLAAYVATKNTEPERNTISLMMGRRWPGKLDRISQEFGLGLRATELRRLYEEFEMEFFSQSFDDPVTFLDSVADLRHRIVHSSGRVDQPLLDKYPKCDLQLGQLIELPFNLPAYLWLFFVPLSEELDRLFAEQFNWTRTEVQPEEL